MDNILESYRAIKYLYIIWKTVKKDMPAKDKLAVLKLMKEDLTRIFKEDVKKRIVRKIKDYFYDQIMMLISESTSIWALLLNIVYKLVDVVDTLIDAIRIIVILAQGVGIFLLNNEIKKQGKVMASDIVERINNSCVA